MIESVILPNSSYYSEWLKFINRKETPVTKIQDGKTYQLVKFDTHMNEQSAGLHNLWVATYHWKLV